MWAPAGRRARSRRLNRRRNLSGGDPSPPAAPPPAPAPAPPVKPKLDNGAFSGTLRRGAAADSTCPMDVQGPVRPPCGEVYVKDTSAADPLDSPFARVTWLNTCPWRTGGSRATAAVTATVRVRDSDTAGRAHAPLPLWIGPPQADFYFKTFSEEESSKIIGGELFEKGWSGEPYGRGVPIIGLRCYGGSKCDNKRIRYYTSAPPDYRDLTHRTFFGWTATTRFGPISDSGNSHEMDCPKDHYVRRTAPPIAPRRRPIAALDDRRG